MTILVTGVAGFVGMHVARGLVARGETVLGIDNLNTYYSPALKQARLRELSRLPGFTFERLDIADAAGMTAIAERHQERIVGVVHLAAQAGVRYSIERPYEYLRSNLEGHLVVLETCRHYLPKLRHLVYASSSSVYGDTHKVPFSVRDPADRPVSLYAATKRADELISESYARLYGIPQTGLRFFTAYGPWGRPDMAYYIFTDAIAAARPITLYNDGLMRRDLTYIDDIVDGVIRALDRPPSHATAPHMVYNLGNNEPVELEDLVTSIETALGMKALRQYAPMQPGDVVETYADIDDTRRDLDWSPTTPLDEGIGQFVDWYRTFHAPR